MLRVTTIAMLAESVPAHEVGMLLGGIASFTSVSRSVAPIIVGLLLSRDNGVTATAASRALTFALPSLFAGCIVGAAALVVAFSGMVATAKASASSSVPRQARCALAPRRSLP